MREEKSSLRPLLAINAVLVLALGVLTLGSVAGAQSGAQPNRAAGEYTMVAGRPQGLSEDALWIVDANNLELMAIRYDGSAGQLRFIDFRDLRADFEEDETPRRRR